MAKRRSHKQRLNRYLLRRWFHYWWSAITDLKKWQRWYLRKYWVDFPTTCLLLFFHLDYWGQEGYPPVPPIFVWFCMAILAAFLGIKERVRKRTPGVIRTRRGSVYVGMWTASLMIFVIVSQFTNGSYQIPQWMPYMTLYVVLGFLGFKIKWIKRYLDIVRKGPGALLSGPDDEE